MDRGRMIGIGLFVLNTIFSITAEEIAVEGDILVLPPNTEIVVVESKMGNPYSKGVGQQIAGGVVAQLGLLDVIMGITFDALDYFSGDVYNQDGTEGLYELFEKAIWIEGSVMIWVGLSQFFKGRAKYKKWKKWKTDHSRSLSFNGKGLSFEF